MAQEFASMMDQVQIVHRPAPGPQPGAQWPELRDAIAMCDATRIAHPQIASDAKINFFASNSKIRCVTHKNSSIILPRKPSQKSCDIGLRCQKITCL